MTEVDRSNAKDPVFRLDDEVDNLLPHNPNLNPNSPIDGDAADATTDGAADTCARARRPPPRAYPPYPA